MIEPVITLGKKTVVAMVHLPALPGSPDYDPEAGMNKIFDAVMSICKSWSSSQRNMLNATASTLNYNSNVFDGIKIKKLC